MIETKRLSIRYLEPGDHLIMIDYMGDKEVLKYELDDNYDLNKLEKFVNEVAKEKLFYLYFLKGTNHLVGHIFLGQTQPKIFNEASVGYITNPLYQNQGFATEAARGVIDYAFKKFKYHRIIAMCNPDNIPSWKVMEKLKMRREGHFINKAHFRNDEFGDPIYWDEYLYAILDKEWNSE